MLCAAITFFCAKGIKMRVAVVYSGRPRDIREAHENHKKFLHLFHPRVDIFAHLWDPAGLEGALYRPDASFQGQWPGVNIKNWIKENWKPIKVVYEKPRKFDHLYQEKWIPNRKSHAKDNQLSMFYSIEKAMDLKRQYEEENNFKYDYVFRMRTDTIFLDDLGDIKKYDSNKIHAFEVVPGEDWKSTGVENFAILDIIAFGGSDVMDKYSKTWSNMEAILDVGCPVFSPDVLLGYNSVVHNKLTVEKHRWKFKLYRGTAIYGGPNYYLTTTKE